MCWPTARLNHLLYHVHVMKKERLIVDDTILKAEARQVPHIIFRIFNKIT